MIYNVNNDFKINVIHKGIKWRQVKKKKYIKRSFSFRKQHNKNIIAKTRYDLAKGFVYVFAGQSNPLPQKIAYQKYQQFKSNYTKALAKHRRFRAQKRAAFKKRLLRLGVVILLLLTTFLMTYLTQKKVVTIIFNNQEEKTTTIQFSQTRFIKNYALDKKITKYEYNCNDTGVIKDGLICTFDTEKQLTITLQGKKEKIMTYRSNLRDFVADLTATNLKDKKGVTYVVKNYDKDLDKVDLTKQTAFTIYEKTVKVTTKTKTIAYKKIYRENKKMAAGATKVVQKGVTGKEEVQYTTVYLDGKKQPTTSKVIKVITKKKDEIIEHGVAVVSEGSSVWDQLAQCESGGNWSANTGNGFYGGLQFTAATWRNAAAHVGVKAAYAYQASREDQIKAAVWLKNNATSGWGQWPACSAKLGLR